MMQPVTSLQGLQSVAVIVPARDEAATVGDVVRRVKERYTDWDVVVIDDASADETSEIARQAGARVIRLPIRLGAWGAVQTGMRYALARGLTLVLTMDADGQHLAESLQGVRAPLMAGISDVAIGVCPERASSARRFAWSLFRHVTGLDLQDVTSGLRAYNAKAMSVLISEDAAMLNYQDIGVLLMLRAAGLKVAEVSVTMNARSCGHSRVFHSWWAVAEYMVETLLLSSGKLRLSWHLDKRFVASKHGGEDQ